MMLGYVRCSTAEQAAPGTTTLQEQERTIRGMAMAMGIGAFELSIYADPAISGAMPLSMRPEGGKLFADAKKGDLVVASKLDRLFRDALDAQSVYRDFQKRGIDLILYDMGMEPVTRDGMSKFFFTMLSAFADLERSRIAERMMDGKRAKKEKGGHIGGVAPYGYRIVGSGREARLEACEDEQVILDIVNRNRDKSKAGIARILRSRGITARSGANFRSIQIERLLGRTDLMERAH